MVEGELRHRRRCEHDAPTMGNRAGRRRNTKVPNSKRSRARGCRRHQAQRAGGIRKSLDEHAPHRSAQTSGVSAQSIEAKRCLLDG
eukprot:5246-Amphidinium_carterae.2